MLNIEFVYDFGSPNAYLVHKVLPAIAVRHGAEIVFRPVLLGGVFKATNNQAPFGAFGHVTGKVDYIRKEFGRFVDRHQVPFKWNDHFPVNTLALMRGAVYAQGKPWETTYVDAMFSAMWLEGRDMAAPDQIRTALQNADLPADQILNALQLPDVKGRLAAVTEEAVERGVFGAPTMFYAGEMFFGKDSLTDLEWRLETPGA